MRAHFTVLFAAACGVASAQDRVVITPRTRPEVQLSARANLRMDVRLVQIPVTVTDLRGAPVLGLRQSNFRLFEDDVERPISALSMSDAPISAGIVFDSSRSMKPRLEDSRAAVDQFLKTAEKSDEFFLVRFSDQAQLLVPFTKDPDDISLSLAPLEAKGWTSLFDAIGLATQHIRKGHYKRRILLVVTDGNDNNSRYSEAELLTMLREADVRVYAINLIERSRFLERICEETGGRVVRVPHMADLPSAMEDLSVQIRSEYVVNYSPAGMQNDGRYHRVRVEVQPPAGMAKVYPSWRRGYLAPDE